VIPRNEFKALLMANPELSLQVIKNLIRLARGHNIRTLEDVRTRGELQLYIEQLKVTKGKDQPSVKRWVNAKRLVLLVLLVFAILQFYFMDVFFEMMSMSGVGRSTCPPETIAWSRWLATRRPSKVCHSGERVGRRVETCPASVQP